MSISCPLCEIWYSSILDCISSRFFKRVLFLGPSFSTISAKPCQNFLVSTPVPGIASDSIKVTNFSSILRPFFSILLTFFYLLFKKYIIILNYISSKFI